MTNITDSRWPQMGLGEAASGEPGTQAHRKGLEEYRSLRRAEIGANIRRARERAGWSQQQMADVLLYSRSHINRVEQGTADLSVADLEILSIRFTVSLRYLVEGDVDMWDKS